MPAWIPLLKISLPYVTQIVTSAIPAFTAARIGKQDPLLAQQIEELQQAATHNAEAIQALATSLQETVARINAAAEVQRQYIQRLQRQLHLATGLAAGALLLAGIAFFT
ncbi:hypothetical protein [Isoalcanivorax indicus]|uniref:hypothetical protein n=1 Tax=Isoalcanivorax indicus TaxID=2202653 RepID=UPI000DBA84AE|nr:hypothetical protein [Isoalcanivorax indicus]